MRSVYKIS